MTLAYRGEYKKAVGDIAPVLLIQEWLATALKDSDKIQTVQAKPYKLLAHCTEKTNAANSIGDWKTVFSHLGHQLEVINIGCCGMAGTYGHETQNLEMSKHIYSLSWSEIISNPDYDGQLVASGFSCRSQVKRIDDKQIPNPLQVLLKEFDNA